MTNELLFTFWLSEFDRVKVILNNFILEGFVSNYYYYFNYYYFFKIIFIIIIIYVIINVISLFADILSWN